MAGERFHFLRNHREATSCLTRSCSFDRGIQREQIRSTGNLLALRRELMNLSFEGSQQS
jgi:hypothetical protein